MPLLLLLPELRLLLQPSSSCLHYSTSRHRVPPSPKPLNTFSLVATTVRVCVYGEQWGGVGPAVCACVRECVSDATAATSSHKKGRCYS